MHQLKFKKLHPDAVLPEYKTAGAAGMDICAVEYRTLQPGEAYAISTGLAVEIPDGYELQCRPRSGLALQGITVVNSPGTIDSDYRGEIKVILLSHNAELLVTPGDRIAQLVLAKVERMPIVEVDQLSDTQRGEGGFGSTGTR